MHLTEKHVKKYQEIYKKIYCKEIDYQEAHKQCTALISFCEIVRKPFPKEGIEKTKKYDD